MPSDANRMMTTLASASDPLPAAAITGLLALAAASGSRDSLRGALLARSDVPVDRVRPLLGDPVEGGLLCTFLRRTDVSAQDATALVAGLDDGTSLEVAKHATHPGALALLTTHATERVRNAAIANDATPLAAAVTAFTRMVDEAGTSAPDVVIGRRWLQNALPGRVLAAWGQTASDVPVLHAALAGRPKHLVPPALLHRLAIIALDAIPDGVIEIGRVPNVPEALSYIANHAALDPGQHADILAQVTTRGLLVHGEPAEVALRLAGSRQRRLPLRDRSWRQVRASLSRDRAMTAALLQVFAEDLGENPLAWTVLDRLSHAHTGTVGALTLAAAAVAADPARTVADASVRHSDITSDITGDITGDIAGARERATHPVLATSIAALVELARTVMTEPAFVHLQPSEQDWHLTLSDTWVTDRAGNSLTVHATGADVEARSWGPTRAITYTIADDGFAPGWCADADLSQYVIDIAAATHTPDATDAPDALDAMSATGPPDTTPASARRTA